MPRKRGPDNALKTSCKRAATRMKSLVWEEKLVRIKAYCTDISAVRRGSMVVMTVFFNTHILKSVFNKYGVEASTVMQWTVNPPS